MYDSVLIQQTVREMFKVATKTETEGKIAFERLEKYHEWLVDNGYMGG